VRGTELCLANVLRSSDTPTNSVSFKMRQCKTDKARFHSKDVHHNPHKIYRSDLTQRPLSVPNTNRIPHRCATTTLVPDRQRIKMRQVTAPFRRSYLKSLNIHPFIFLPSQSIHSCRSTRAWRLSIAISWRAILIKILIIIKLNKESHLILNILNN